ncbi:hypothetical protein ACFWP7_23690 [Streptomyces sp. NPDC058470]|uniref:hypothetical protein n=1 Tax=Streptomyces sp. NPDC058470 TaxID=3346515 RepID=UPI0036685E79
MARFPGRVGVLLRRFTGAGRSPDAPGVRRGATGGPGPSPGEVVVPAAAAAATIASADISSRTP